jgi:hypothetical protein
MKYIGWIISVILIIAFIYVYRVQYMPLKDDIDKLEEEITMWENVLKGEKGLSGDRKRFTPERFFKNNKLTPYGEVEILRKFDLHQKSLELYISAPKALTRAEDVLRFLTEQRIVYKDLTCIVVIDSVERFEYKFSK